MPPADSSDAAVYRTILKSSVWVFLMRWGIRLIGLVNTIILARLLTPEDFGIVAMSALLVGFLNGFMELGAESLLIREPHATRDHCNTAWTIRICQGAAMAVLLLAMATPAAMFFNEPRLAAVIHFTALCSLINGFTNIGMILIRKELQFAKDFRFGIINRLTGFVIVVCLAFLLRDYWAIVYAQVAGSLFVVAHSYLLHPYRPRLSFAKFRQYFNYSLSIVPLTLSGFLIKKVDVLIVGRLSGTGELGVYNVSSELSSLATREIVTPLARSLYPNFAKIADNLEKLVEVFGHVLNTIAIISIPISLGLWAVADTFTIVLLGQQWTATIPLLKWLAIYGAFFCLTQVINGHILLVVGKERLAARLGWVRLVFMIPLVLYGAMHWGPEGAAGGMTIAGGIALPITSYYLMRSIPITLGQLIAALWRPAIAGPVMALVVTMTFSGFSLPPAVELTLSVLLGATVYPAVLFGLWVASGKPAGTELVVVRFIAAKLRFRTSEG